MKALIMASVVTLGLIGCGEQADSEQQRATGDHVWSDMTGTIDKAKAVEGVLQDAEQRKRQAME